MMNIIPNRRQLPTVLAVMAGPGGMVAEHLHDARGAAAFTRSHWPTPYAETASTVFSRDSQDVNNPGTWPAVIDNLLRFRRLEDDWDGAGSEPPDSGIVDTAITLAQRFAILDLPVPDLTHVGVNGTVVMEWHAADVYQEVEVVRPMEATFLNLDKLTGRTELIELSNS